MENQEKVLRFISPNKIHFDAKNPRGETESQILNDKDFKRLRNSIKEVGVIVPIIVRPRIDLEDNFYLIDGERRLRASIKEKIGNVPIRIVKDETDGRIIAYQIHMHRKDWSRSIEVKAIMSIIKDEFQDNSHSEEDLKEKLIEFTNHTPKEIQQFLNLFRYEQEIVDLVISSTKTEHSISYIDQIEASFISPLKRNYIDVFDRYGETELRKILGYKFKNNLLVKSRYLMDTFNSVFQNTENKEKIEAILVSFLTNKDKNIADSYNEFQLIGQVVAKENPLPEKIPIVATEKAKMDEEKAPVIRTKEPVKKTINNEIESKKGTELPKVDSYAPIKLSQQQQTSINDIRKKYENISKTFSEEELKYIEEAITCLCNGCLKAATLMIWASCVSRILNFINKDVSKFNTISKQMKDADKSFYKTISRNFQTNTTSIEEIRQASMDRQILCYICYEKIIDITQLDKLKGHYVCRNNCAHPTKVKLSTNEVISIFENIFDYVFNNLKLK